MKPGFNHQVRKGRLTEFSWRYYERKVGCYLDYYTPLVASADGRLAFRTRVVWRPHGDWFVRRMTNKLMGNGLRVRRDYYVNDTTVLDLRVGPFRYVNMDGTPHDYTDFDPGVPLADLHESFKVFITGCAACGEFTPLADWLVENVACVADLFTGPGDLK